MARGLALARWRGAMLVLLAAAQPCVAIDPVHSMMEPPPPKLQRPRVSRPVVGGLQRAGILASLSSPSLLLLPAALMGLAVAFPEPMARLALHVLQPAQNTDSNSGRQGLGLASASPAQWRVARRRPASNTPLGWAGPAMNAPAPLKLTICSAITSACGVSIPHSVNGAAIASSLSTMAATRATSTPMAEEVMAQRLSANAPVADRLGSTTSIRLIVPWSGFRP